MSSRTKQVIAATVAIFMVAGLALAVLSGLGGRDAADPDASTFTTSAPERNAQARAAPDPALQQFYDQTLSWEQCGDRTGCASMEVPLDYAEPGGRTIDIALLKHHAGGERQGSLVVNPGGPGARGTEYARQSSYFFREPIINAFDIVGFDPRGTGGSAPVDCLTDEELDAYVAGDPDPDTPEEQQEYVAATRGFNARCAAADPELVGHVSTIEAARDMDVLRALLEEEELTYFGASYGTQLGATYADLFPDFSGRLVLDGGVDLSLSLQQMSLEQARGFETALRAYIANCLEVSESCFLGSTVDEGVDRISEFLTGLDAEPLVVGDRELTQGNAFYGIAAPLYDRASWLVLTTAIRTAFGGDGEVLLSLSDAYTSRSPDGDYADNTLEANVAINCLDGSASPAAATGSAGDVDGVLAEVAAFEEASPTFGRAFAWSLLGCSGHELESSEELRTVTAAGAPPIVVVGTTRDPATPMAWSEALAEQLEPGVLVRRDGDGHTGYNAGNSCVDTAVEDFLLDGMVPQDGLSC